MGYCTKVGSNIKNALITLHKQGLFKYFIKNSTVVCIRKETNKSISIVYIKNLVVQFFKFGTKLDSIKLGS